MKRKNGLLTFESTTKTLVNKVTLQSPGIFWGNLCLQIECTYIQGKLFTDSSKGVPALKLIKNSVKVKVFDLINNAYVQGRQDLIDFVKIDCGYNCFGYSFADRKYFINDPSNIVNDEYDLMPDITQATHILLMANNGASDTYGNLISQAIHVVNINADKTISFKPGITELIENQPLDHLNHTYNVNHCLFLKAKQTKPSTLGA